MDVGEEIQVIHRKEILNLLVHPPCPECGAYEGQTMLRQGAQAAAFLNCANPVCRRTLFWENSGTEKEMVCRKGNYISPPTP